MKYEKLTAICNGLHLWNFNKEGQQLLPEYRDSASFSEKELVEMMLETGQTKAILIIDRKKQEETAKILKNLEIDLEKIKGLHYKGHKIVSKKLSRWSADADLWMVKWLHSEITWETST